MSLPEAARRSLLNKRVMDHQGVTTRPRPRHCRRCGAAVIAAIDDCGITVALAPHPTTPAGELVTLLAGGHTWTVWHDRVSARDHWRISSLSANDVNVHARHECGKAAPEMNMRRMNKYVIEKRSDNYAEPPF